MMQYICKYSPIELIKAFGTDVVMPNHEVADFNEADRQIHSNICSHARQFLLESDHYSEAIIMNCCDSLRRVADTLSLKASPALYMLDLPHTDRACAVSSFAGELRKFAGRYAGNVGKAYDRGIFLREWETSASIWDLKRRAMNETDYIAIMGARVSEELLMAAHRYMMPYAVEDLTCLGSRSLTPPPEGAEEMDEDGLFAAYAEALLHQIPCMRMAEIASRRELTEDPHLKGILYNTIRFCDYYDFEYAALRKSVAVPVLKIESDYTAQTRGQLMTRFEAFAEQLGIKKEMPVKREAPAEGSGRLYVGIDSGSTTTNAVAIDGSGEIKAFCILRTGAKASAAAESALRELAEKTGTEDEGFARICATGYGRMNIPGADIVKTEITCHARGAHVLDPDARCVIDIGGQDSKVIALDEDGQVSGFVMNDKCAAGTGRFLEMMASTLQLDMAEMDRIGLEWKNDLTISSTCTVFAESEVISLIADDKETADIIHGLNKAVAARTFSLIQRAHGRGPFMMTGGVARNPGLVREIEVRIGERVEVPEYPDLAGALGAALFARDGG